jgi:hypothetical protein
MGAYACPLYGFKTQIMQMHMLYTGLCVPSDGNTNNGNRVAEIMILTNERMPFHSKLFHCKYHDACGVGRGKGKIVPLL